MGVGIGISSPQEWPGAEGRKMHENLLLFSTYSLVLGKTTSWSGLQASPTRCPSTSCPPVRRRPHPPLPKRNTTRTGIWTSLGLAQVSLSWWSGVGLDVGRGSGRAGCPTWHLEESSLGFNGCEVLPPSFQAGKWWSEHIELSQGVNVKQGNPASSSVPAPAFGKQVALQSRVGSEQG